MARIGELMQLTGGGSKPTYPSDHLAAMTVPKGGSCCKNCEYLKDPDKKICGEPNFVAWQGPNKPAGDPHIPGEIDSYCSDWYQPAEGTL